MALGGTLDCHGDRTARFDQRKGALWALSRQQRLHLHQWSSHLRDAWNVLIMMYLQQLKWYLPSHLGQNVTWPEGWRLTRLIPKKFWNWRNSYLGNLLPSTFCQLGFPRTHEWLQSHRDGTAHDAGRRRLYRVGHSCHLGKDGKHCHPMVIRW